MKSIFVLALIAAVQAQTATTTAPKTTTTTATTTTPTVASTVAAVGTSITTAASTALAATQTAAMAAAAIVSNGAQDLMDKMSFFKNSSSSWVAFNTDLVGNTAGWAMTGSFGTRVQKKGDNYQFMLEMNVLAPTTFVSASGQIWQMYVTFNGWDPSSTATSQVNNSVMGSFTSGGSSSTGWTSTEFFTGNYCSANSLSGKTSGGYTAVSSSNNVGCTNGWGQYPVCDLGFQISGRMQGSCELSRWFEYPGTNTISVGLPVTFTAGFYNWASSSTGSTVKPTASGVTSTILTYTIIEGAVSLATMTVAAAALITLSF